MFWGDAEERLGSEVLEAMRPIPTVSSRSRVGIESHQM